MVIVVLNRLYVAKIYKNLLVLLYALFWVIPKCPNFICQCFGTLCLFHFHWRVGILHTYLPMKMEQTECSKTLAYKIRTLGNYPEESIQHSEHDESLKSRIYESCSFYVQNCKFCTTFKPSVRYNKNITPVISFTGTEHQLC